MRLFNTKSVKFKIVSYTMLCLALVGILSNLYLYSYMSGVMTQKAADIDDLYINTIQRQIDTSLSELKDLAVLCASSDDIARAMRNTSIEPLSAKQQLLQAQKVLNDYLRYADKFNHVNKMMIFNKQGLMVQANGNLTGTSLDVPNLISSELFFDIHKSEEIFSEIRESVSPFNPQCLPALFPITGFSLTAPEGSYLYLELDLSVITDILAPYSTLNPIFVVTNTGDQLISPGWAAYPFKEIDVRQVKDGDIVTAAGKRYRVDIRPLNTAGLSLYNCTDLSAVSVDDRKMSYTFLVVIFSVLLVSAGILLLISNYVTSPIRKLIVRIKKISGNDFSYDPEIEKSGDEIGEIGKVVNEMNLSIGNLLRETREQSEQKKNIEIDLLQSQVNPHFLYNTLDSIHWMAVIQKNPGICSITKALSNLLKNMSKGFSQKVTLEEELKLLEDYVTIQSIRYLETFELVNHIGKEFYHNTIVKLTLQPLVENAIFHGIEPSGISGTITLDAKYDGDFLVISVEDSGVGMTPEELETMKSAVHKRASNSMNGIGFSNVDARLRLIYGTPCGLTVESEKGRFTRVSIRVRKEEQPS